MNVWRMTYVPIQRRFKGELRLAEVTATSMEHAIRTLRAKHWERNLVCAELTTKSPHLIGYVYELDY